MSIQKLIDLGSAAPRVFLYATGAGAGIQKNLWDLPGCSNFLVGCSFPYDTNETSNLLGFTPERFVSDDMAMQLAMAAYLKASKPGCSAIGVGLTASVASTKEHRGEHRIFVSSFSEKECLTWGLVIPKGSGFYQRSIDGDLADHVGLAAIFRAAGLKTEGIPYRSKPLISNCDSKLEYAPIDMTDRARELILANPLFYRDGTRSHEHATEMLDKDNVIFYPGSFNPLHMGHIAGSEVIRNTAAYEFGQYRDIVFTTVVNPPHKAALTAAPMLDRVSQMRGRNFLLTQDDPLFVDKAKKYPGGWFGVGADTLINMLDPKWGVPTEEVLSCLASLNVRVFVLGRLVNGEFMTLQNIEAQIPILSKYNKFFVGVPGRWDISSTELRAKDVPSTTIAAAKH